MKSPSFEVKTSSPDHNFKLDLMTTK